MLLVAKNDNRLELFRVIQQSVKPTLSSVQLFEGHTSRIKGVAFGVPDDDWFVSVDNSGNAYIWDIHSGDIVCNLYATTPRPFESVAINPATGWIALGQDDGIIRLYTYDEIDHRCEPVGHKLEWDTQVPVLSLAFSPDGHWLAAGGQNKLWMWPDVQYSQNTPRKISHSGTVWSVFFSLGSRLLVTGNDEGVISIWDNGNG